MHVGLFSGLTVSKKPAKRTVRLQLLKNEIALQYFVLNCQSDLFTLQLKVSEHHSSVFQAALTPGYNGIMTAKLASLPTINSHEFSLCFWIINHLLMNKYHLIYTSYSNRSY